MALQSPGVQVTIIDESNYTPSPTGTVPFVVVATAENKLNPSGTVAAYTTAANAGRVFLVTSQRELVSNYGKPNFMVVQGTPVHGYELNEYGLLAAYSALGVSNAAYIIRADVDLSQLTGTQTRPSGSVANGQLWLDTAATSFGILEWNSQTGFRSISVANAVNDPQLLVITSAADIVSDIPVSRLGRPGDYAVDTTDASNPLFFKAAAPSPVAGQWVAVGSANWFKAWPAVVGANSPFASSTGLYNGTTGAIVINTISFTVTNGTTTLAALVTAINASSPLNSTVKAGATANNRLALYFFDTDASHSMTVTGVAATALGFSIVLSYYRAAFQASKHTDVPAWDTYAATPRPTGSVWFKTSAPNNGANFSVKRYNSASDTWTTLSTPVYATDAAAIYGLDASSGGSSIASGATYMQSDVLQNSTFTFKLFTRKAGVSTVTGSDTTPLLVASTAYSFTINRSVPGEQTLGSASTVSFTTAAGNTSGDQLVSAINGSGISYISAALETSGAISITHSTGGYFELVDGTATPLAAAGITTASVGARVSDATAGTIVVSNWLEAYTNTVTSGVEPAADPADGTYWYYNNSAEFDIMIHGGSGWRGYLGVNPDSRGYDLSQTSPAGPIVSASQPTVQSDNSALVSGDLWINTSNFEDFPRIYRYSATTALWTLIDNTDHTTSNGIVFADARWAGNSTSDVVTGTLPTITALLTNDTVDSDCPSYTLYPRGTLLFNTRRSGMNVKEFVVNHFPSLTYKNAWVSASGNDSNGVAYMGRRAQRNLVAEKMAAAVANSTEATEETRNFNLMVAPGYPELNITLAQLNINRKETAFIIADSPLRLSDNSTALDNWSRNLSSATTDGDAGFNTYYEYMAGYYPSGYTTDLDGVNAVVPASHMVLRSMIRSDQKSYPWFAPAGMRRGTVDNASAVGYIDGATGRFQSIGVPSNLRDVLYNGKVNPISVLSGSGIVIYGQKTRSASTTSLDRVNVARLIVYLRRQLDLIARQYIFEPNDEITRKEIKNQIEKELNSIQVNRGLYDYLVVCDTTNNTPDRVDRNELWVDVAIEPSRASEFIYVPVRIMNTGAIAAGI